MLRLGVDRGRPVAGRPAAVAIMIDDRPDMDVLADAGTADEALEAVRRILRSLCAGLPATRRRARLQLRGGHTDPDRQPQGD